MIRFGVILLIAQVLGNPVGEHDEAFSTTSEAPLGRAPGNVCEPAKPGDRGDYHYHAGIGYIKFHTRVRTWDEARLTCIREGAQLEIIQTPTEALVLHQMVLEAIGKGECTTNVTFVGIHDFFEVGFWSTVLGYPLECTRFDRWVSHGPGGSCQTCGAIYDPNVRCGGFNGQALIGLDCTKKYPFFCKLMATP